MNVPNHSQTDRIARDMGMLMRGEGDALDYWRGNSYHGIPVTLDVKGPLIVHGMKYDHWGTTIAIVKGTELIYFNARYISTTTRGFQSRILRGLRNLPDQTRVQEAYAELALPTHQRSVLDW